jgi:hypothetical protein
MFNFPSEMQREKLRGKPLKMLRDSSDFFYLDHPMYLMMCSDAVEL